MARNEARLEVQRDGDVDSLLGSEDRAVVGQPLHSSQFSRGLMDGRKSVVGSVPLHYCI
jgi:hypothetical protein